MGSYLRVNSKIFWENFEINVPCPWLYNMINTLNFLTICCISTTQKLGYLMNVGAFRDSWAQVMSFN